MKHLLLLSLLFSTPVLADEYLPPKQVMLTDSGRIFLDNKPCAKANDVGFLWQGDATEKDSAHSGTDIIVHKACWLKNGDFYFIWFHDEVPEFVVTQHRSYFKPF